ncbi:ABC transporter type 1, transmembrane domain-containing protein [Aspergillus germanicus]
MLAYLSLEYKPSLSLLPPAPVQVSPSQPHSWKIITVVTDIASAKASVAELRDDAKLLALYFVYLGVCRFLLSHAYDTLLTYTTYHITRNIRHAYLRAALSQDIALFDLGTSGSITARASSNGRLIPGGISKQLGLLFQGLSTFVTALILAFTF